MTSINWQHLLIKAKETDLSIDNVPEDALWDILELEEFEIRLVNSSGGADVIDMGG